MNEQPMQKNEYPTSPWTEAFHTSLEHAEWAQDTAAAETSFEDETVKPTHDALSDIYNRGY
jgi:hypothetical protein